MTLFTKLFQKLRGKNAKRIGLAAIVAIALPLLYQNCSMQEQKFSEASSEGTFAGKEDQVFNLLQEAQDLSVLLKTYDFNRVVLKGDGDLKPDEENKKTWKIADDLKAKADFISDELLVQKTAVNSDKIMMEMDQLLNLLSSARDQSVKYVAFARDIVLQTRVADLEGLVGIHYAELTSAIGKVRADLDGFKQLVSDRFADVEAKIAAIDARFDDFKGKVSTFMSEQTATNASLGKAIQDATDSLQDQIDKEKEERKQMGMQLSKDFAAALDKAKAELNSTIDDKFKQSMAATKAVSDKLVATEAALAQKIADGDAAGAAALAATKKALQTEMKDQADALRADLEKKIAANDEAIKALQANVVALQKQITTAVGDLKVELQAQLAAANARITENQDKTAQLAAGLVDLKSEQKISADLIATMQNEMAIEKAQELALADLQAKVCKDSTQKNCVPVSTIKCDVMFNAGTSANVQCKAMVDVIVKYDAQVAALDSLAANNKALIDGLTKSFNDLNNRVTKLEELPAQMKNLTNNVAKIAADFQKKLETLEALTASNSEAVRKVAADLAATDAELDGLKAKVDAMADLSAADKAEVLAAIAKGVADSKAYVDQQVGPINEEVAKINSKLESMAIEIALLNFKADVTQIQSALRARAAANAAWITRRSGDIHQQFCRNRTNAALNSFDYQAGKMNWVFCKEKMGVLRRASEYNSLALAYTENLGALNVDVACNVSVKNAAGETVPAGLLKVKDMLNADVLAAVQKGCGVKGRPAAMALMVNIVKFMRLIGPDFRTFEYMGDVNPSAAALILGAPYSDISDSQLKSFRNIDPTSDELALTPYGQIERLFPNRYIEGTFRIGHLASGAFPVNPNDVKQPSSLGSVLDYGTINTGAYSDPSYGSGYGARLKALEITSADVGFKVVSRNKTSTSPGKRYRFPLDADQTSCPVDDDVLVRHSDNKWYGYHVDYDHVNERFSPVLWHELHSAIATDATATDDSFTQHTQAIIDRAGLTLAKIPRRIVVRASVGAYTNAYNRPNCVRFGFVNMMKKGEWEYTGSNAPGSEVVQRNNLYRYLTGFSDAAITQTCNMQTYARTKWVKIRGTPIYSTTCTDIDGAVVSCTSSQVANTNTVQTGTSSETLNLVGVTAPGTDVVVEHQVGMMNFRNLWDTNNELRTSFSARGPASIAAQQNVVVKNTQLAEGYWMYKDADIGYTAQNVVFSKSKPMARSFANMNQGLSTTSFVRELDKNAAIIAKECEHCPGNTKILGPCNKTDNTKAQAEYIN